MSNKNKVITEGVCCQGVRKVVMLPCQPQSIVWKTSPPDAKLQHLTHIFLEKFSAGFRKFEGDGKCFTFCQMKALQSLKFHSE